MGIDSHLSTCVDTQSPKYLEMAQRHISLSASYRTGWRLREASEGSCARRRRQGLRRRRCVSLATTSCTSSWCHAERTPRGRLPAGTLRLLVLPEDGLDRLLTRGELGGDVHQLARPGGTLATQLAHQVAASGAGEERADDI